MARKAASNKGRYAMLAEKRATGQVHGLPQAASRVVQRFDPTDPASIEQFRAAAANFRKAHLGTQESARKVLASEGIYTLDGQLTKEYRT
jgi:hypothetical protein